MSCTIKMPETPELVFESVGHIYRLNGFVIPSVSEVMQPITSFKYEGISESVLNTAADKGTIVHNAIENYIKFGIEDITNEHKGYFDGFLEWWKKTSPEVVASEIKLYHKILKYGGTIDLLVIIDGVLTLVDIKTTSELSDMTCGIQLEAYSQALKSLGINVGCKAILHLKNTGKYEFRTYPVNDIVRWKTFGSLKCVYDYMQSYK